MAPVSYTCLTCGDTAPPNAVFCISCGAALQQAATSTTQLLAPQPRRPLRPAYQPKPLRRPRRSIAQPLIIGGVTLFGLALLAFLVMVAYVGSYRPGLSPAAWLFVLAGGVHLVRGVRRGAALAGMRYATLCAAIPFVLVTEAFITTTVLFGGLAGLLLFAAFVVACTLRRRWRP